MMYNRYIGTFGSTSAIKWEVRILQDATQEFASIGKLRFPYNEPLTIEWCDTSKEDVLCGSMATLTIISPGDRTYEDLYTIATASVRLDVYRNDALYWSGTLDPEFYEEPYCEMSNYEVTLTFSDFGILDRYKYDMSGLKTLNEIMAYALGKSAINYHTINQQYISTSIDATPLTLDKLSIRSENFYDEDGEACTLRKVIEGILQPLGIRMIQRAATIYLYDLNGLYSTGTSTSIIWNSNDQTLGVDRVANNAKITFSPYSQSQQLKDDIEYIGKGNDTNYLYFDDYDAMASQRISSFNFIINGSVVGSNTGQSIGLAYIAPTARYFKIEPLNDASEATGVAYSFVSGNASLSTGLTTRNLGNPADHSQRILMKTHRIWLPKLSQYAADKYRLRLTQEMLLDARYNPFVGSAVGNEKGNYSKIEYWMGYVMIPATITLYNEDGKALMHYSNEGIAKGTTSLRNLNLRETIGSWKSGAATYGSCWLEWYNTDDRTEKSGVLGWQKNRQCVGLSTLPLSGNFKKMDSGQYIPYPTDGGYIEVCIYSGIWPYDFGESNFNDNTQANKKGLYNMIRWMLYKTPKLELLNADTMLTDATIDDVEYTGVLNSAAKEDITLDTICGTMRDIVPSSRGVYYVSSTGLQLTQLTRANRTETAEQLLIGTLYSQYAQRRTMLTGTAAILSTGLRTYTETMQPGKKFIAMSDVQNCATDESEVAIIELRPDEYTN